MTSRLLDPRTSLGVVALVSTTAVFANRPLAAHAVFATAALCALLAGAWRGSSIVSALYGVIAYAMHALESYGVGTVAVMVAMLGYMAQKFFAFSLLGMFVARTTSLPGLVAALQAMNMHRAVVVPLLVAVRFFPTIRQDLRALVDNLRTRNILVSWWHFARHPLRSFEYVIVPLLMRSITVSDELAASALTRGLGSHRRSTIVYPLGFSARDAGAIVLVVAAIASVLALQFVLQR